MPASTKAKKQTAAARLVGEEVFRTPELRDTILEWAIFRPPKRNPSGSTSKGHKLKVYGKLATVCKEWESAVRGQSDMLKKILSQYSKACSPEVCGHHTQRPATSFPVPPHSH